MHPPHSSLLGIFDEKSLNFTYRDFLMAAKLTLNQKIRSVFSHSRRLRLEVLEDRRLLSAVATSTEDDSIAFICGTCG